MKLEEIKQPNIPDLYSVKKVAEFLKMSYAKVYRLIKLGKIKAINAAQTGTKPIYRITGESVQQYLDSVSDSFNRAETIN